MGGTFLIPHAALLSGGACQVHPDGDLSGGCAAQVYLGKWHSSEVAIKCLNPSLFFSGSDGTASKAAMADLLREADLLASLRHPNVVWVYGVVLPRMVRQNPWLQQHHHIWQQSGADRLMDGIAVSLVEVEVHQRCTLPVRAFLLSLADSPCLPCLLGARGGSVQPQCPPFNGPTQCVGAPACCRSGKAFIP